MSLRISSMCSLLELIIGKSRNWRAARPNSSHLSSHGKGYTTMGRFARLSWRGTIRLIVAMLALVGPMVAAVDVAPTIKVGRTHGANNGGDGPQPSTLGRTSQTYDSSWPVGAFLHAESRLEELDARGARAAYREMIEKALNRGPDEVSTINAFAMWRFLHLLGDSNAGEDAEGDKDELVAFAMVAADQLLRHRSQIRRFLSEDISLVGVSLASFEADIWSLLAGYAWHSGDLPRSVIYLSAALSTASDWTFDFENDMADALGENLSVKDSKAISKFAHVYGLDAVEILRKGDAAAIATPQGESLGQGAPFRSVSSRFLGGDAEQGANCSASGVAGICGRLETDRCAEAGHLVVARHCGCGCYGK